MKTDSVSIHKPVLLSEVLEILAVETGDVVVDATSGGGGHSKSLCERAGSNGLLITIDKDKSAVKNTKRRLSENMACTFLCTEGDFRYMDETLKKLKVYKVDKVLFDLGMSSDQLERSGKGFSFRRNEPIIMTFSDASGDGKVEAVDILNFYSRNEIEDILRRFGEEKHARRISEAIVSRRKISPIATTSELVDVIENAVPQSYRIGRLHSAVKTFQALRIAVNDELPALSEGLCKAFNILSVRGRMAVISFHSLEDRIVKNFFKKLKENKKVKILTKKPVVAKDSERKANPRSRSAKLRVIEKL